MDDTGRLYVKKGRSETVNVASSFKMKINTCMIGQEQLPNENCTNDMSSTM